MVSSSYYMDLGLVHTTLSVTQEHRPFCEASELPSEYSILQNSGK